MPPMPIARDALGEPSLVRPELGADHPEARLQGRRIDAHALDGAGRGALAGADLGALEGRTGGAGRGQQPVAVAEHDSALVPTSTISEMSSRRCGPSDSSTAAVSAPTWPAIQGST